MPHLLDIIKHTHIDKAAYYLDEQGVDKDNEWNEYFVEVHQNFYPFKYLVGLAYQFATGHKIGDTFKSNKSNRNKIRDLGYNIRYVKGGIKYSELKENGSTNKSKIARITWNYYGWVTPSGYKGKSRTQSYEKYNGFGHEEWNFNAKFRLGEYKYGFLEPINKCFDKYAGEVYDISLFTRNGVEKVDYWVTTLKDVEIPCKEETDWVLKEYKKNGWFKEMKNDLKNEGLDEGKLDDWVQHGGQLFNIKFKVSQIWKEGTLIPIEDKSDIPSYRYTLMNMSVNVSQKYDDLPNTRGSFEDSGKTDTDISPIKYKRSYSSQEKEIEIRHGQIQREFMKFLQDKYGMGNVKRECRAYGLSRIDIIRKTPEGEEIYYEVKSYANLLTSLRQSIGQLLEYCLYPDVEKAKELVLVSDIDPQGNDELLKYVDHLRDYLKIPFSYICFNPDKKEILYMSGQE